MALCSSQLQDGSFLFLDNLGISNIEPPTTPHITRHGTKARSMGAITANVGLCITNAKYVVLIEATTDIDNIIIFFLALILELHDIVFLH